MKPNIDLTLDRDFRDVPIVKSDFLLRPTTNPHAKSFGKMFEFIPETRQMILHGIKIECANRENSDAKKDFNEFVHGVTLVATGSKYLRKYKVIARGETTLQICDVCGKPRRIPWRYCTCMKSFFASYKEPCISQLGHPIIIR